MESTKRRGHETETLLYRVNETPPWYLCILLSIQQFLTCFSGTFSYPIIISGALCLTGDDVGLSEFINTVMFVSGLTTLLQTTLGVRLPIVQGPSYAYITPIIILMAQHKDECPDFDNPGNKTLPFEKGSDEHRELWKSNLSEVQGSMLVATLLQIFVGYSGLMNVLIRYIGPLTIAPTISLIGLSLYQAASGFGSTHWWICFLTIFLVVVFCQYLRDVSVPLPGGYSTKIFVLFPVLLAILLAWLVCLILTLTEVLPSQADQWGYRARTDIKTDALMNALWFRMPYPGQWGVPTVSLGGVLSLMAASIASMIESVGDYYACARLSGAPPPRGSDISRGIGMEGIGGLLSGAWGAGGGSTSLSQNIGAIGITRVGSRIIIHLVGVIMIVLGTLGKVGALFAMIPDPIIGGLYFVTFGMVTAVGISNLQHVDLNSPRNLFVLGLSFLFGLGMPAWVAEHPLDLGNPTASNIVTVLGGTSMLVGGGLAFVLDNTIPGTRKERGLLLIDGDVTSSPSDMSTYDIPFIQPYINRSRFLRSLPFCSGADKDDDLLKEGKHQERDEISTRDTEDHINI